MAATVGVVWFGLVWLKIQRGWDDLKNMRRQNKNTGGLTQTYTTAPIHNMTHLVKSEDENGEQSHNLHRRRQAIQHVASEALVDAPGLHDSGVDGGEAGLR